MNEVKLEGKECILPIEDPIKHLLLVLKMQNDLIDKAKELLKDELIKMFNSLGEYETSTKIIEKGLPKELVVYGDTQTLHKNPIISIRKTPIVEKGKILLSWNEYPNFENGGFVGNVNRKKNESKESFENRKSILKMNPFPTFADTLPKQEGFVLNNHPDKLTIDEIQNANSGNLVVSFAVSDGKLINNK